jgi:hypothetical protein
VTAHLDEGRHRGFVHVTDDDVTATRTPTPEQSRAIELLELAPPGCPLVRLTLAQWAWVDRVVRGLGALGIPAPRQAHHDDTEARR